SDGATRPVDRSCTGRPSPSSSDSASPPWTICPRSHRTLQVWSRLPARTGRRFESPMPAERLQKLLAQAGVASRRRAEELVAAGRVMVNGTTATLGMRADPGRDRITLDGQPVLQRPSLAYLAVHKPSGLLSSTRDERGRRSVLSLIGGESELDAAHLWPAGRLDADSEGLMLLTNDGEWANHVLH